MKLVLALAAFLALTAPALGAGRAADLRPAIEAALIERGAPEDAVVTLAAPDLPIPEGAVVEQLSYNPQSGRFVARAAGAVIAGAARRVVQTPVLIAPVARGEEVSADNIAYLETSDSLPADVILAADEIAGKSARRNLAAGAPVRGGDIVAPVLVRKNSAVTVSFERPGVFLTQTGEAQANGAEGDVIDIETSSGRVIRAVVTGRNAARVLASRHAGLP